MLGFVVGVTALTFHEETFLDSVVPVLGLTVWQLILLALILIVILVAGRLVRALLKSVFRKTPFPQDMERRIAKSSMYLVLAIGLLLIPGVLGIDLGAIHIFGMVLTTILRAVVIVIIITLAASVVSAILSRVLNRTALHEDLRKSLISASRILVYVIGAFVIFSTLGMDLGSLILGLGAFSIAISFALADIIKNITAGMLVQADKPFRLGDTIKVGGTEGRVIKTKIRTTILETKDGHLAYIPNTWFMTKEIINKTPRQEAGTPTEPETESES
ncbi:MAG: mechanosensitive ion channel domain-containing protein [Thermoplasmata archaeon]